MIMFYFLTLVWVTEVCFNCKNSLFMIFQRLFVKLINQTVLIHKLDPVHGEHGKTKERGRSL